MEAESWEVKWGEALGCVFGGAADGERLWWCDAVRETSEDVAVAFVEAGEFELMSGRAGNMANEAILLVNNDFRHLLLG